VSSALLAAYGGSLEITLAPTEATVAGLRRKLAALGLAVEPQTRARPRLVHGGVELREAEADDGRLRRGHSVILPPSFSFVWRIPIRVTNSSSE
jgi:hypothetical protein